MCEWILGVVAERCMMAENVSSERNSANRNSGLSDSDDNSVDRANPVSKRAKRDQVAAIVADLDITHDSIAPRWRE